MGDDKEKLTLWESGGENKNVLSKDFEDKLNGVKTDCADGVKDSFWISKQEILDQLAAAKTVEQRVDVYATWTDKYWLEAVLSRMPILGDLGSAIVSTCFLFDQWRKMWLSKKEMRKIFWYQAADMVLWAIPFWNLIDFFYKGNEKSSKIFKEHVEKLKQVALEKWATQEEINSLSRAADETLKKIEEQDRKNK